MDTVAEGIDIVGNSAAIDFGMVVETIVALDMEVGNALVDIVYVGTEAVLVEVGGDTVVRVSTDVGALDEVGGCIYAEAVVDVALRRCGDVD